MIIRKKTFQTISYTRSLEVLGPDEGPSSPFTLAKHKLQAFMFAICA